MLLRAKSRIRSRNAACCSESSKSITSLVFRPNDFAWCVPSPVDHHGALERDHLSAILVEPDRAHGDDAGMRLRFRFAGLEHLRARVDGVSLEHRAWQAHLIPPQV